MKRVVFLDSGPLGLVTNPKGSDETAACNNWLQSLLGAGTRVILPEIADYEVRRELLRAKRMKGVRKLDRLASVLEYLPITTAIMRRAAELWAQSRQKGHPTAGDKTIDADMILVAQALVLNLSNVVIATTNVAHLGRFVHAQTWRDIAG